MPPDTLQDIFALKALQDELTDFVRAEHSAQRDALSRILSKPTADRIEEGRCITNLRVESHGQQSLLCFSCPANDSRFREGDLVRLSHGDPMAPLSEATITRAEDYWVEVLLWKKSPELFQIGTDGLQIDESILDLEAQYLTALDDLGKSDRGRNRILPLLLGARPPRLDAGTFEAGLSAAKDAGFDDAQSDAVAAALATDLCWLIHGPPGTGKTRVLAWIAAALLEKGERILVSALTHRAINNLLEAIAERIGDRRRIVKVAPFEDPSLNVQQFAYFSDCPLHGSPGGYIVGATPISARTRRLGDVDFDTCLVDEASQITLPLAIMAMLCGERYIFAGDHKQLPPVTLTLNHAESPEMSIFKKLEGRGFDTLLPVTHRLNDALCEWPSASFYLSHLRPHPAAATRRLDLGLVENEWQTILGRDPSVIWLAVPHEGCRTESPEEALVVRELIEALHRGGAAAADIGVVVPFRRQARRIRQLLVRRRHALWDPTKIVIDTVERMQGQEREIVVVSFTASDASFVGRVADFLFQPQRLNVAATRARRKLILVASPTLLGIARGFFDPEATEDFVSLLEQAHRIDLPAPAADSRVPQ